MERKKLYEGYLRKSPPEKKMERDKWRMRYFRLWNDKKLEYYKDKIEKKPWKSPIDLSECCDVSDANDHQYKKQYKNGFQWPFALQLPNRVYILIAVSKEERSIWKEKICELCPEIRRNENVTSEHLGNSKYSPNSTTSPHCQNNQQSESDPILIPNPVPNVSYMSDNASWESENSFSQYDELPPPRAAASSPLLGAFESAQTNPSFSPAFSTSYDDTNTHRTFIDSTLGTGSRCANRISIESTGENRSSYDSTSGSRSSFDSVSGSRTFDNTPGSRNFYSPEDNAQGRSVNLDSDSFAGSVYDVPPSSTRTSIRKKQTSTKISNTSCKLGYVKMDASVEEGEDYIDMHSELSGHVSSPGEEYIQMEGGGEEYLTMHAHPQLVTQGSVKEFKPFAHTLTRLSQSLQCKGVPHYNNVQPLSPNVKQNTMRFPLNSCDENEVVFDEIPEISKTEIVGNRSRADVFDPPIVNRNAKPSPAIDRTTKPRSDAEEPYVNTPDNTSGVTGYISLSHHEAIDSMTRHEIHVSDGYHFMSRDCDGYQRSVTNTPLTSTMYINADDKNNNNVCVDNNNNNRYSKKGRYSSQRSHGAISPYNDTVFTDTNNNYGGNEEYVHKDLPALPVFYEDDYNNKELPSTPDTHMFPTETNDELYLNVSDKGLPETPQKYTKGLPETPRKYIYDNEKTDMYLNLSGKDLPAPPKKSKHEKKCECDEMDETYLNVLDISSNDKDDECYENVDPPQETSTEGDTPEHYQNAKTVSRFSFPKILHEECYENVSDDQVIYPSDCSKEVNYTVCKPQGRRKGGKEHKDTEGRRKGVEQSEVTGEHDSDYIIVDPVKSAAAKNLR